ncbi:MAG: methyl-accepting chemotaxis protein [Oceanospirillaceae bacterium]|nr:methyl-accepting chemotaxis protein [Oceanospirillaceae bacterium]
MKIFTFMSIKLKLSLMVLMMFFALVGSMSYSLLQMNNIGIELVEIAEEHIPMTNIVSNITINQLEQAVNFERALRYGEQIGREKGAQKHFEEAMQHFNELTGDIDEKVLLGEHFAQKGLDLAHSKEQTDEYRHVLSLLQLVESQHKTYVIHAKEVFNLIREGQLHEAIVKAEIVEVEEEELDKELEQLLKELEDFTQRAATTAENHEKAAFTTLSILTVVVGALSLIGSYFIINSISQSLSAAIGATRRIATGDLSRAITIEYSGELGELEKGLQQMQLYLHDIFEEMSEASSQLVTSSKLLLSSTNRTSSGISEQKSQLVHVSAAVNQMTASVLEVAQTAEQTSDSAQKANTETEGGKSKVQSTIESIEALAQGVENASVAINQVGDDSEAIGRVVEVIKAIAAQTNLLALNAAIEAARAGEQGRGFAVVADEVRTLAQRTQESTAEIEEMIEKLQTGAKNAVEVMETGRSQAVVSVERATDAGKSLEIITANVNEINDMNTQIAYAAKEQSAVSEDINQNITKLNTLSEENTLSVHEAVEAIGAVSLMAEKLQEIAKKIKV